MRIPDHKNASFVDRCPRLFRVGSKPLPYRMLLLWFVIFWLVSCGGSTATATLIPTPTPLPTPASIQELVRLSLPSAAQIVTEGGSGTGFVYEVRGESAHIVTNAHVVGSSRQVTVELNGETYVGQVLGADEVADVAAVEICCGEFRALRLSGSTEVGQEVVAIGYALGLKGGPTVTRGIVSAKRHHIPSDTNVIQTDATINRGNSGGPMLSLDGSVIGMSTWKLSGGTIESVGFAVMAVEVGLRVSALANPDTIIYAGRQFERVAGPLDVVVAGHGETDKGLTEYLTYVRAEEFVIDSTLSGAEETLTYYINATRGDQLFPAKEGIAVREVGCVRILLNRDGESWDFDSVEGQATARWRVGATVRMYVVAEESKVYLDGQLHCEGEWGFGRAGTVSLHGEVGARYSNLSIWMELVDSQSLLNGRSGAVLATPTVEITPVATSTPESPDTPTSTPSAPMSPTPMSASTPRAKPVSSPTSTPEILLAPTATPAHDPTPAPNSLEGLDREALVALYNATGGPQWKDNTNWMSDGPIDEWYGVVTGRCTGTGSVLSCFDDDGVASLSLMENGLRGEIPPELSELANLVKLDLGGNELSGEIPPELGRLSNLIVLDLRGNVLSGKIPPELGNLTKLTHLVLLENALSGEVPPELGNLARLKALSLRTNQLGGEIPPELGRLSNLELLSLRDNNLRGAVPSELGTLAKLATVRLAGNELSGCVPTNLRGVPDSDFTTLGLPFCSQ